MSGLMYSRAVLNSALFSFTLRQFMLRILRFCFFGRSYGHSLVVVLKSLSLGVLWEFCENWFRTAGMKWTKSMFYIETTAILLHSADSGRVVG